MNAASWLLKAGLPVVVALILVGVSFSLGGTSESDGGGSSFVSDGQVVLASSGEVDLSEFVRQPSLPMRFDEGNVDGIVAVQVPCSVGVDDSDWAGALVVELEGEDCALTTEDEDAILSSGNLLGIPCGNELHLADGVKEFSLVVAVPASDEEVADLNSGDAGAERAMASRAVDCLNNANLRISGDGMEDRSYTFSS